MCARDDDFFKTGVVCDSCSLFLYVEGQQRFDPPEQAKSGGRGFLPLLVRRTCIT